MIWLWPVLSGDPLDAMKRSLFTADQCAVSGQGIYICHCSLTLCQRLTHVTVSGVLTNLASTRYGLWDFTTLPDIEGAFEGDGRHTCPLRNHCPIITRVNAQDELFVPFV